MPNVYEQLNGMLAKKGLDSNTRQGINWLRTKINELYGAKQVRQQKVFRDSQKILQPGDRKFVGKMYMFRYNPIRKDQLPYWDEFPLIFVLNIYRNGFLGMNLHYLPPKIRTDFLLALDNLRSNDHMDETTRIRVSYELIRDTARLNTGLPIVRRYLKRGILSNIIQVLPNEWAIASLLPTESFTGASKNKVWQDTRNKL